MLDKLKSNRSFHKRDLCMMIEKLTNGTIIYITN